MAGYKGPLGDYINGDLSKEEFIEVLKAGAAKGKAKGGGKVPEKKSLQLEDDGDDVVDDFGYANWVGDITDDEYAEFFEARK